MNGVVYVRPEDVDDMLDILATAKARLHARGIEQWPERFHADRVLPDIHAKDAYFVLRDGVPVATFILNAHADPDFWHADEREQAARYVSKLATIDGVPGLGTAALDWCGRETARQGAPRLRLDAWRTNEGLHRYYVAQGFTQVRTAAPPHRNSGALFERAALDVTTDAMRHHHLEGPAIHRASLPS